MGYEWTHTQLKTMLVFPSSSSSMISSSKNSCGERRTTFQFRRNKQNPPSLRPCICTFVALRRYPDISNRSKLHRSCILSISRLLLVRLFVCFHFIDILWCDRRNNKSQTIYALFNQVSVSFESTMQIAIFRMHANFTVGK